MIIANNTGYTKPGSSRMIWVIARRQMLEAIRDRSTLTMTGFFLLLQAGLIWFSLGGSLHGHVEPRSVAAVGSTMAFFLLYAGLIPSAPAIGIAAGVFAGDKERGCLTPILVTPASNLEIFAGKVLGAVLPALLYALLSVVLYFVEISLFFGADKLQLLPVPLTIIIILLIPAVTLFGAALASIISSRVATFQSAQNYSSLITTVVWVVLFILIWTVNSLGLWAFAAAGVIVYALAVSLVIIAATTWRREEVMARQ